MNPHAIFRIELTMPNGDLLERDWTYSEKLASERARELGWLNEEAPHWIEEPKTITDTDEPITFSGRVKSGFEEEARRFVGHDQRRQVVAIEWNASAEWHLDDGRSGVGLWVIWGEGSFTPYARQVDVEKALHYASGLMEAAVEPDTIKAEHVPECNEKCEGEMHYLEGEAKA